MEFHDCVSARRSVWNFAPDPVDREVILDCLNAARLSPSSLNCQPWRFLVIDNPILKNKVAGAICNPLLKINLHARQAPVLILVVSDLSESANPLVRTALRRMGMIPYDIGSAVQTLCLAAADHGLGSCILGSIRNRQQLRSLLDLGSNLEIHLAVALGYPASGQIEAPQERLPLEELVTFNPGSEEDR